MRVLVTGSRDHNPTSVAMALCFRLSPDKSQRPLGDRLSIIHGDARGADRGAHIAADQLGANEYRFPADWEWLGKPAGMIRNVEMLETMKPDLVLAFPLGVSKGTRGCIREAQRRGIPVEVYE